jgi:hypothetical protein
LLTDSVAQPVTDSRPRLILEWSSPTKSDKKGATIVSNPAPESRSDAITRFEPRPSRPTPADGSFGGGWCAGAVMEESSQRAVVRPPHDTVEAATDDV